MNDIEGWKPVAGYEGLYEISDRGRVASCARRVKCTACGSVRYVPSKIMKQKVKHHGYSTIVLCKNAKHQNFRVNVLVATHFHGARPAGKECSHIDGDKLNNRVENLVWETHAENERRKRAK